MPQDRPRSSKRTRSSGASATSTPSRSRCRAGRSISRPSASISSASTSTPSPGYDPRGKLSSKRRQSLVPMMNFRLATPAAIIDLNRIPGLADIATVDGVIAIGAMARQRQLEFATLIREQLPLLSEAIHWVGHLPTRTRGTIGGSIAHADPAAEIPMVLQAVGGEVVVRGLQDERRIAAPDLFLSPL